MSNLPPGVKVTDIPGNRPEDEACAEGILKLCQALDILYESGFSLDEVVQSAHETIEEWHTEKQGDEACECGGAYFQYEDVGLMCNRCGTIK